MSFVSIAVAGLLQLIAGILILRPRRASKASSTN